MMPPLDFFKALADDTRLNLLMLMYQLNELCVCELSSALALSQPKISRHLAILREAELISARRKGKWVYYQLSQEILPWHLDVIKEASMASNNIQKEKLITVKQTQCC